MHASVLESAVVIAERSSFAATAGVAPEKTTVNVYFIEIAGLYV